MLAAGTIHLPSLPSSLGHLQAADQRELLSLLVQHTDCDPLVGVGHPQSPGPKVAVVSQRQRVKPDKNSQDLRVI